MLMRNGQNRSENAGKFVILIGMLPHITPFRHTLAEVMAFIMSWLWFPVFAEPTSVPSSTSSKVNMTPLAIITARLWHQNRF